MDRPRKGRPRKLTKAEVQQAAADRRAGMTWAALRSKYKCAVNTLRSALAEYSDEFLPFLPAQRSDLVSQLMSTQAKIERIEKALKKRFNLHV